MRGTAEGRAAIVYTGNAEITEWHYVYKSSRRFETGSAVWASPALAVIAGRPMAFIGGYDQTLHALNLVEKKVVWRKITNGEIQTAPVIGKIDGLDVVFFSSADRTVYAYVAYNGRQSWTKELVPPSPTLGDVHLSSPLVFNNKLYITCFAYDKSLSANKQEAHLFCLDLQTGKIYWKLLLSTGFLSSPVGFIVSGRPHIAVAARRGLLQAIDVSHKIPRRRWSFQMPHEVLGSPVIITDTDSPLLFLGSKYGNLIAIDAARGKERWQRMVGNWIDNTACIGEIDNRKIVFVGSHDYRVYAFDSQTGDILWKTALGGEVFSAPCFFSLNGQPMVAAAALDSHLYIMDARTGEMVNRFFTGNPVWDKVAKGETLWGSPVALEAGNNSALVFGSYSDMVYVLPLVKECSLTSMARSSGTLWFSLLVVLILFVSIILPIILRLPGKSDD